MAEDLPFWVAPLGVVASLLVPAINAGIAAAYRPRAGDPRSSRERALAAALEAARIELQVMLAEKGADRQARETARPPAPAVPPPPGFDE